MSLRIVSDEVLYAIDPVRVLSRREIECLAVEVLASPTGKRRICLHPNPDHALHEMLVGIRRDACYPPHMHIDGEESYCILYGSARIVIYTTVGNVDRVIPLASFDSDRPSYVRIPSRTYHYLDIESEVIVYLETKIGPFRPEANVIAPFV